VHGGEVAQQCISTSNIAVQYTDEVGRTRQAVYRWLGGVYILHPNRHLPRLFGERNRYHIGVCWTDAARGDVETGNIRIHKGARNPGLIVEIVPIQPQLGQSRVAWEESTGPIIWSIGRPSASASRILGVGDMIRLSGTSMTKVPDQLFRVRDPELGE
jgi:hypothetical protein